MVRCPVLVRGDAGPGIGGRPASAGRSDRLRDRGHGLLARGSRRDAGPLPGAGRCRDAKRRPARGAADAGRGAAAMTATEPLPVPTAPPLPEGLDTPCLVVDLDVVDANARRMADGAAARGVALRPHVKTHKSVALARLQLDRGAVGITVGTLGEAEVMVDGGIEDVFVGYPI